MTRATPDCYTNRLVARAVTNGARGIIAAEAQLLNPNISDRSARGILSYLASKGRLFAAGHRLRIRYFATRDLADGWNADHSVAAEERREREQRAAVKEARVAKREAERAARAERGPGPNPWAAEHLQLMRNLYPTHGAAHLAVLVGRPKSAVHNKAHKMGLKCLVAPERPKKIKAPKPPKASRPDLRQEGSSVRVERSAPKLGPAYLDGPLVFTDKTRRTVYPSMPQPTRTNTHTAW